MPYSTRVARARSPDERRAARRRGGSHRGTIPSEILRGSSSHSGQAVTTRVAATASVSGVLANAIARAHGGAVEVDSADDETMFRLVLPRQPPGDVALA
jgi:hypothetical protein